MKFNLGNIKGYLSWYAKEDDYHIWIIFLEQTTFNIMIFKGIERIYDEEDNFLTVDEAMKTASEKLDEIKSKEHNEK